MSSRSMSTVVLLSSSPPRDFAQSPTPADSSSPFPSTAEILHGRSPGKNRFKQRSNLRDEFSTTFSTARRVLAEKKGAENATISSPGRRKFRSSQGELVEEVSIERTCTQPSKLQYSSDPDMVKGKSHITPTEPSRVAEDNNMSQKSPRKETKATGEDDTSEPLFIERAIARRLDWTPPTTKKQHNTDENPVEYSAGYLNGVLTSFVYKDNTPDVSKQQACVAENPAKRKCIESRMPADAGVLGCRSPILTKQNAVPSKVSNKRSRSPTKKALTITALATSAYVEDNEPKETRMMQYLTSTQAQLNDTSVGTGLETKVQKTKAAVKKLKTAKKNAPKSLLLSPKSAMKTHDEQEAIFGSASQLARDESPTFLRETIEAMKQSESFLRSDPFSSPPRTQPISADQTPQAGTVRFRKTQNLWAAAGRDEDNALLHVDMIDMTDTPAIRAAFAGKDALIQPGSDLWKGNQISMGLRGGYSPLRQLRTDVVDIGDIDTPVPMQTRKISTTQHIASPRKSPARSITSPRQATAVAKRPTPAVEPRPEKPNYAGWATRDLNKQITSYGFKAMRKREKMIELLERCWEEKYGPDPEAVNNQPESVPYGDFLSKVHDISARPEPKVKKPRVRTKKAEEGAGTKEKPLQKPRQRKKKEDTGDEPMAQAKPKAPRKRKSKAAATNSSILDIDDVLDTVPEELRALEAFDDWARPPKKPKEDIQKGDTSVQANEPLRPPTPPATIPSANDPVSSSPSEGNTRILQQQPQQQQPQEPIPLSTPDPTPTPSTQPIPSQITSAIMHQSRTPHPGRNHHTHPTWHEKILLYDPIILEDLAVWLNTEGLGSIGDDREVSALDVREWCESRGICCLWRGGWRGNKLAQS